MTSHNDALLATPRYVREALDGGEERCCEHFGDCTWRIARLLGIPTSETHQRLLDLAEARRVLLSGRGTGHGIRRWPVSMAGELWESTGA